jgi:iron complex outermembrane receptor protein
MTPCEKTAGRHDAGRRALALICVSLVLCAAGPEDNRTDIGTVQATGTGADATTRPAPGTAAAVAPSRQPLQAAQPTSVIGKDYIENNVPYSENFDRIIQISPSVSNVEPTGIGLQQNFQETIRGFRYTQFNNTFDGLVLPGSIGNLAPQTGAYFLAHDIKSISIDRGPGTASQIGYATFGGTVAVTTVDPANTWGVNPYGTIGSWGLRLGGLRLDTGAIPQLGGTKAMIDAEHEVGNGYLTGTSTLRNNVFGKAEAPIGDNTVLTVEGMYNYARTHTPYGATEQQIRTLGPNYALNYDPLSQAFTGYNVDNYYTDFDYIGIKSNFGDGWSIDDKAYTASYYHNGTSGKDVNGTTPNLTGSYYVNGVKTKLTDAVPGYATHSDFRAVGNSFALTKDTAFGQARAGLWVDYNSGSSYKTNVILSDNLLPYATKPTQYAAYKTLYNTTLTTVQPYVEFAAKPLPGLTITPGLKYTFVARALDATIISSAPSTAPPNQSWDALLPAIDAHYEIMKGWVAYAQIAEGFLAPPLNALTVPAAGANPNLKPQTTVNYQIGTTFQNDRFSLGLDAYFIQFQNYIVAQTIAGNTSYTNNGGAVFKGIEAEATVKIGGGLAIYANATANDATYDGSGFPVAQAPRSTGAIGPIFQRDNFYGSLLAKYVGPQYALDETSSTGQILHPQYPIPGFYNADLAVGYKLVLPKFNDRSLALRFNLLNIFNDHSITGYIGSTAANIPLLATNPGRAVIFSISAAM